MPARVRARRARVSSSSERRDLGIRLRVRRSFGGTAPVQPDRLEAGRLRPRDVALERVADVHGRPHGHAARARARTTNISMSGFSGPCSKRVQAKCEATRERRLLDIGVPVRDEPDDGPRRQPVERVGTRVGVWLDQRRAKVRGSRRRARRRARRSPPPRRSMRRWKAAHPVGPKVAARGHRVVHGPPVLDQLLDGYRPIGEVPGERAARPAQRALERWLDRPQRVVAVERDEPRPHTTIGVPPTMSEMMAATSLVACCSSVVNWSLEDEEQDQQDHHPVLVERRPGRVRRAVHETGDDARAVERWDRQQVEDPEHDVDVERVQQDLERRARVAPVRHDRAEQDREQEVGDRAGDPDERHPALRPDPEVPRVDRHRAGPAEQEASHPVARDEEQAPERVQVHDRVQRETPHELRGGVAEAVGDAGRGRARAASASR